MSYFITPMLHNVIPFDVTEGFVATFGVLGGSQIQYATFTITSQTSATPIITKTVEFSDPTTDDIREFSYTFTPADLSALSNGNRYVMSVTTTHPSVENSSAKSNMVLLKCYDKPVFACTVDFAGTSITKPTINLSLIYSQAQGLELNYYYATLYGIKANGSQDILSQTDREYNGADIVLQRYPMPNSSENSPYTSYKIILSGQMKGGTDLTFEIVNLSMREYGINVNQSKFVAENLCNEGKIKLNSNGVSEEDYLTGKIIEVPNTFNGVLGGALEIQGDTLGGEGTPDIPIPITSVESPISVGSYGRNIFPKIANSVGTLGGLNYSATDGRVTFNGTTTASGVSISCPPLEDFYFTMNPSAFGTTDTLVIKYLNGEWFAGGVSGSLAKSSDGVVWTPLTSGFGANPIYGLGYHNGLYIAVGNGGKLTTSTNGINWTLRTSGFGGSNIRDILYANGLWVISGNNGKIATSTNGTSWTLRTTGITIEQIRGLAYGNGIFVATGQNGVTLTSPDGINWTQRTNTFGTSHIYRVAFGNGMFVAVGENRKMSYSRDGVRWYSITTPLSVSIWNVVYGNNRWVATGANNSVIHSFDGINWTQYTGYTGGGGTFEAVGYGGGRFMFGGTHIYYGLQSAVQRADDIYWGEVTSGFGTSFIHCIGYNNGLFISVGAQKKIFLSTDGINWTQRTSNFTSGNINAVAYGSGKWVAVGDSGQLATSTDNGNTWVQQVSGFGTTKILAVAYGNGIWVAVGSDGILTTSSDGVYWTARTSGFGATEIRDVWFGNNLFVIVGVSGNLATSTDGINWTLRTSSFGGTNINTVWYDNGLWVAGANDSKVATSTDGITWTQQTIDFGGAGYHIQEVAYGNGLWFAVGTAGKLTVSPDGINWVLQPSNISNTAATLASVVGGNGLTVVVGQVGTAIISLSKNRVLEKNKTYTLSTPQYYGSTVFPQLYLRYIDGTSEFISATNDKNSFTLTKDVLAADFRITTMGVAGTVLSNAIIAPQLESGSVQKDFVAFNNSYYSVPIKDINGNIYTLDRLSSTIYDKIYYNVADKKWYIEKKTKTWFLNGVDTTFWFQSKNAYNIANFEIANLQHIGFIGLSDRFQIQNTVIANTTTEGFFINANSIFIRINISRLTGWSDAWTSAQKVSAFNTWLSANNTTIIEQPATPLVYELHPDTVLILQNLISKYGSTYLFSTDTTTPYYKYLNFDGIFTGEYLIKRRKFTDSIWVTLETIPNYYPNYYIINNLSDLAFAIYDTYNASGTEYQYALVPINLDGTEGTYMAFNITSDFNGAYLCDHEKSYSICNELKFDSFERVQNSGLVEPFGSKYPTIQNNATLNYDKGTFTFNIMATNYPTASDIDRKAEVDLRKEIADFITNGRMKIIKDYNGNVWLVATYNGATYTFFKELGNGVTNLTFDWVEKGDANSEADLEKMGMLNKFKIVKNTGIDVLNNNFISTFLETERHIGIIVDTLTGAEE